MKRQNVIYYLGRIVITMLFLAFCREWLLSHECGGASRPSFGLFLDTTIQLDLFRALFYSVLPAACLLLFFPVHEGTLSAGLGVILPRLVIALAAAWLPWWAVELVRPPENIALRYLLIPGSVLIFLNIFWLLFLQYTKKPKSRIALLLLKIPVAVDLIFPVMVWTEYRHRTQKKLAVLRIWPAALICSTPFLLLFFSVQPIDRKQTYDPAVRFLNPGEFYQVIAPPSSDRLILTNNSNTVTALNRDTGEETARCELPIKAFINAVDYIPETGELIHADRPSRQVFILDAASLTLKDRIPVKGGDEEEVDQNYPLRTMADAGKNLVVAYQASGTLSLIDRGGDVIAGEPRSYTTADVIRDEPNDLIHILPWNGREQLLKAVRPSAPSQPVKTLRIDETCERLALGSDKEKLYITQPSRCCVLVINRTTYKTIARIPTLPGVRFAAIDEKNRRLVLGGFAPALEIRSLDDYSLIDRIKAPPWIRWIAIDDSGKAYITSLSRGLFTVDCARLGDRSLKTLLRKADPFYPVFSIVMQSLKSIKVIDVLFGV